LGFQRSSQHLTFQEFAMSVPKDRPQPGPGAPLTAEREQYRRLMAQGLNNHQACLLIGVKPTTGMRWNKGRNMVDHTGKARYYPPIHAEPVAILTAVPVGGGTDPDRRPTRRRHSHRSVAAILEAEPK
jgi:hypothetical protein